MVMASAFDVSTTSPAVAALSWITSSVSIAASSTMVRVAVALRLPAAIVRVSADSV